MHIVFLNVIGLLFVLFFKWYNLAFEVHCIGSYIVQVCFFHCFIFVLAIQSHSVCNIYCSTFSFLLMGRINTVDALAYESPYI